ncbi:MAG: hypothetical protein ACOYMD_02010 [Paludibacter sp.]
MKAFKLIIIAVFLFSGAAQAQLSINVHIGSPPQWGPAGYSDVRYYYLPDVEAYYDIHNSTFIYIEGRNWVHRKYLPSRYRNYDLYNGYKVVMSDYRGNTPYIQFKDYKSKYAKGYRGHSQPNIGRRNDNGYSNHRDIPNNHSNKTIQVNKRNDHHNNDSRRNDSKKNEGRGNDKGRK